MYPYGYMQIGKCTPMGTCGPGWEPLRKTNGARTILLKQDEKLRQIYTEELPGVAAHDSLFILLRRVILRSCASRRGNSWAQ